MKALVLQSSPGYNKMVLVDACGYCLPPNKVFFLCSQEAGRHQLSVKYGGEHVKNSPFTVRVSGAPDPEKVKVYGPGVEHGVLGDNQTTYSLIFNYILKMC